MKEVYVGVHQKHVTFFDTFNEFKSGHLRIILISDILDYEDIIVPKSLKSLHILSKGHIVHKFVNKNITIYLNGVKSVIEDIEGQDSALIASQNSNKSADIILKNVVLGSVIGSYESERLRKIFVHISQSTIQSIKVVSKTYHINDLREIYIYLRKVRVLGFWCVDYTKDNLFINNIKRVYMKLEECHLDYIDNHFPKRVTYRKHNLKLMLHNCIVDEGMNYKRIGV